MRSSAIADIAWTAFEISVSSRLPAISATDTARSEETRPMTATEQAGAQLLSLCQSDGRACMMDLMGLDPIPARRANAFLHLSITAFLLSSAVTAQVSILE